MAFDHRDARIMERRDKADEAVESLQRGDPVVAESTRIAGQRRLINFEGWRPRTAHDTRFSWGNGGNPF